MPVHSIVTIVVAAVLGAGFAAAAETPAVSGTFSIIAAEPESGVCGAAVASKYPSVGTVVPYVREGVGAFCTQHWHEPKWGERALDLLAAGKLPEEVLGELLRDDKQRDKRQLAIIDMSGSAANRNPANADPEGVYWGTMSGRYYACQGNTLAGRDVIVAMAQAYEEGRGSLADRLIAAMVAGDRAGGDHRGRLAAGIRLAKRGGNTGESIGPKNIATARCHRILYVKSRFRWPKNGLSADRWLIVSFAGERLSIRGRKWGKPAPWWRSTRGIDSTMGSEDWRKLLCPKCRQLRKTCTCINEPAVPNKSTVVRVGRETKGRGGKGVTIISDLPLEEKGLTELAARLKTRLGTGGTVKDGRIEIQGDQRDRIVAELEGMGYKVKRVGG